MILDPGRPARLASLDGAAHGLKCEYEYSRERGTFLYRFTRNGRFLSYETNPHPTSRRPGRIYRLARPRNAIYLGRRMSYAYPDPCPHTGRRVVTVAEWNERPDELIDEYAYWYHIEAAEDGFDPWVLIEGIDPHTRDDKYDVLFVRGSYRTVSGDQKIYVRPQHYDMLRKAAVCGC